MITQIQATFANGVLTPDVALPLPEQSRVRLTVEAMEVQSPEKAIAALESIWARLKERPINGDGVKYTREQLHERR